MGSGSKINNTGGIAALVQDAAKIARQRQVGLFDESEESLDREITREEQRGVPKTKLGKVRRKGEHLLHSKYVLILVISLNLIDILLVLGELMLDIHYVTDLLTKEHKRSNEFIATMKKMYPDRLSYLKSDDIYGLEHEILIGQIVWNASGNSLLSSKHRRERREGGSNISNEAIVNMTVSRGPVVGNTIEVDIAHGLHKASIAIVGILCVEVLLKMFCFGTELLQHKLECFDVFIVISSFVVDLALRKGLQQFATPEFAVILSFLVPWRFIRVANSLIVAVMDHEHFRIMVLYKKKKAAQKALQEANDDIKGLEACVDTLQKLCTKAGFPHAMVQEKIQRALQGNITLTELVESTLIVGAVTVLDSESPALIRRALLEDRVKQSPAIQTRGRSRTWTGTELARDYPRPPKRPSPLTPTLKTPERALPGNITITRLVERTLSVGSVSVLDDESPARMRRAILEDKAKRSPVIERISRSVTWAGAELPQDWPRQAPSVSTILKPTMKALGSPVIQKRRQSEMDRNGIVPRFTKTSAEFTTINLDNNNPSKLAHRKDATEVTSSGTKASDLINDYSEVTFF